MSTPVGIGTGETGLHLSHPPLCDSLKPPVSFCQSSLHSLSGYGTVSVFLSITPSFFCVPLCHALLSTPAPFIWPCHWAMCAVPVSKTAGRLSSFPSWRMWGQRGSCERYRLGSVKALPVGKLPPPAFLLGSHSELACLALKVLTYMQHCPLAFTCHIFNIIHIFHNHNVVATKSLHSLSFFLYPLFESPSFCHYPTLGPFLSPKMHSSESRQTGQSGL